MRGQVLGVDRSSGEGQISGDDGQRYVFKQDDWRSERGPAVGVNVDFTIEGSRALCIFRLPEAGAVVTEPPPLANDRNKYIAALLAFFVGTLGIHRFYLGRNGTGVLMIVISATIIGLLFSGIWAFIDTIRYLLMSESEFAHRYARR